MFAFFMIWSQSQNNINTLQKKVLCLYSLTWKKIMLDLHQLFSGPLVPNKKKLLVPKL